MDKDRRANFLRKLHSFAGVFPLGIFLCFHMCVNYSANWGTTPYDTMGSFMAHMPYKVVLETFVIFLPLLFHALYGVYISLTSSVTVKRYRYFRNWCYVLQRIAGIVTLLFVIWHIYGTKLQVELTGVDPSYAMVAGIVATPIGLTLFAIGLLAASTTSAMAFGRSLLPGEPPFHPAPKKYQATYCSPCLSHSLRLA